MALLTPAGSATIGPRVSPVCGNALAGSSSATSWSTAGWVVFLSGFFEPVLYLLSIGIGVGQLVGDFTCPTAAR